VLRDINPPSILLHTGTILKGSSKSKNQDCLAMIAGRLSFKLQETLSAFQFYRPNHQRLFFIASTHVFH
jgi:hypothetical protein